MAGLGFKDFAVGEVLTSADVDGYLMQQTVMRFADSGARGSALGTATGTAVPLAEGMVTYLDDTNQIEVFDGSVWRTSGSILQVATESNTTSTSLTGSFANIGISVTITPVSSTSFFIVEWNGTLSCGDSSGSTLNAEARILDADDTVIGGMAVSGRDGGDDHGFQYSVTVRGVKTTYGNTSSRTFRAQALGNGTTKDATNRNLIVWEIES